MNVETLLHHIRRGWTLIVPFVVVITGLAGVLTAQRTPMYTATAQGFVSITDAAQRPPGVLTSGSLYILARMTSYAQLAQTPAVLDPVATTLPYPGGESALRSVVSAASELNTPFIDVSVNAADPALATRAADAVVAQLAIVVHSYENGTLQLKLSSGAQTPVSPSNRDIKINAALAAVGALLLACAVSAAVGWLRYERPTRRGVAPPALS